MDSTTIIFSLLFGSVGMAYLVYGKKEQRSVPFLAGVALCAFPYLISNKLLLLLVGVALVLVPFIIRD